MNLQLAALQMSVAAVDCLRCCCLNQWSMHLQRYLGFFTHTHPASTGKISVDNIFVCDNNRCSRTARCLLGQQVQQQTSESVGGKLRNKEKQSLTEAVDALELLVKQQGSGHIHNSTF